MGNEAFWNFRKFGARSFFPQRVKKNVSPISIFCGIRLLQIDEYTDRKVDELALEVAHYCIFKFFNSVFYLGQKH